MKKIAIIAFLIVAFSCKNQEESLKNMEEPAAQISTNMEGQSIYQFKVKDITGNEFDFSKLKGKKVMIVNTASECGLTPQYEDLQSLYSEYKSKNFVIIGFPANNFEQQEPGTNKEIATFCTKNYGVTFPMMGKISVQGEDQHPVYQFLTQKGKNGLEDNTIRWNFQKYLINEAGHLDKVIAPQILPTDEVIINWIKS